MSERKTTPEQIERWKASVARYRAADPRDLAPRMDFARAAEAAFEPLLHDVELLAAELQQSRE